MIVWSVKLKWLNLHSLLTFNPNLVMQCVRSFYLNLHFNYLHRFRLFDNLYFLHFHFTLKYFNTLLLTIKLCSYLLKYQLLYFKWYLRRLNFTIGFHWFFCFSNVQGHFRCFNVKDHCSFFKLFDHSYNYYCYLDVHLTSSMIF